MTCRKKAGGCGYEFCWICMESWLSHKMENGNFNYKCNKFVDNTKMIDETKSELEKYVKFFEFFKNHEKAEEEIVKNFIQVQN